MKLSVVVPTRNRGTAVLPAVQSILASIDTEQCELIVIDQSESTTTHDVLQTHGLLTHPQMCYQSSTTRGASRARNAGASLATSDVIAFVDDDCTVPASWVRDVLAHFEGHAGLAMLYGAVLAPTDAPEGWTPEYRPSREGRIELSSDVIAQLGFSANLAVLRDAFERLNGFDERLGAGSTFPSAEDTDLGYRALCLGLEVAATNTPAVTHYGHRAGADVTQLRMRYVEGMAAMCLKHVRCGDFRLAPMLVREVGKGLIAGSSRLLRGRAPSGYRAAAHIAWWAVASCRHRINRPVRVYSP